MTTDRIEPYDHEAERSVLGAIMLDQSIIFGVITKLSPPDFYTRGRQHIYSAMIDLANEHAPIDAVTLVQKLRDKKVLNEAGGMSEVSLIEDCIPTTTAIEYHTDLVKGLSVRRQAIRYMHGCLTEAYSTKDNTVGLLQDVYENIFKLNMKLDDRGDKKDVYSPSEIADFAAKNIEYKVENPGAITGIKTNYDVFDEVTGGVQPVTVIAGATGTGKTALCLNLACRIGILDKVPTLYINCEMTMTSMVNRILATMSGVTMREISTGTYHEIDSIRRVSDFADQLEDGKLFLTDNTPKSLSRILALIQKHYVQDNIELVIVDYIGEIEQTKDEQQRGNYHSMGDYIQVIKDMCNLYSIKAIFAAQLGRKADDGEARKEMVAESYKIVNKADVFIAWGYSMVVDTSGEVPRERQIFYMLIDKNRGGKQPVKIYMDYDKANQQITEIGYKLPPSCEEKKGDRYASRKA